MLKQWRNPNPNFVCQLLAASPWCIDPKEDDLLPSINVYWENVEWSKNDQGYGGAWHHDVYSLSDWIETWWHPSKVMHLSYIHLRMIHLILGQGGGFTSVVEVVSLHRKKWAPLEGQPIKEVSWLLVYSTKRCEFKWPSKYTNSWLCCQSVGFSGWCRIKPCLQSLLKRPSIAILFMALVFFLIKLRWSRYQPH